MARQAETLVDQGLPPNRSSVARLPTFGDLVELHIADMCAVRKPPRRSKAATLATLKGDPGKEKIGHLDRHKLIDYGRKRADQGAGPATLGIDVGVIRMILTHAAAVHGLEISVEGVDLARVAPKRLGRIGKGVERDRRPTMAGLNPSGHSDDEFSHSLGPKLPFVSAAAKFSLLWWQCGRSGRWSYFTQQRGSSAPSVPHHLRERLSPRACSAGRLSILQSQDVAIGDFFPHPDLHRFD